MIVLLKEAGEKEERDLGFCALQPEVKWVF
jgi:hypothetical protein